MRGMPSQARRVPRIAVVAVALVAVMASGAPSSAAAKTSEVLVAQQYDGDQDLAGFASLMTYCARVANTAPVINTYPGLDFQANIEDYLKAPGETIVTWFGGYRMQYYASRGLLTPVSDVWQRIGGNYTAGMKALSTGADGKQYFVPLYDYPWVVMYRRSVFAEHGYQVPTTLPQLVDLAARMQADGLVPLALPDWEGWEALGTFDILDLRLNGYVFHMGLMNGTESWTDPRVTAVFEAWRELLPYMSSDPVGTAWWTAMDDLAAGNVGMYYMGTFAAFRLDPSLLGDIGVFPFPALGTAYDREAAIEAPVDGLVVSTNTANLAGAKKLLACAGTAPAQLRFTAQDPGYIAAARTASTSTYTPLQKAMASVIGGSGRITQFFDRDTRPDFASWMYGSVQGFLADPGQDLDAYLAGVQAYWDGLSAP